MYILFKYIFLKLKFVYFYYYYYCLIINYTKKCLWIASGAHNHLVPGSHDEKAQANYIARHQLQWKATLKSSAQLLPYRRRQLCTWPHDHPSLKTAAGNRLRCKLTRNPGGKDCPFWIFAFEDATGDGRVLVYQKGCCLQFIIFKLKNFKKKLEFKNFFVIKKFILFQFFKIFFIYLHK